MLSQKVLDLRELKKSPAYHTVTLLSKGLKRRILNTCFRCPILLLILDTSFEEILKHLVGQACHRDAIKAPSCSSIVRKSGIDIIRKIARYMAGKIGLTVRDELRDMITTTVVREAIAGESVTIVREVLFRESDETILYKINSSHIKFLLKVPS
jgi:hypothetical protein